MEMGEHPPSWGKPSLPLPSSHATRLTVNVGHARCPIRPAHSLRAKLLCAATLSDLKDPRRCTYQHSINFNLQKRFTRDSISS